MPTKIFVSHSTADEILAAALVECLLSSMILQDDEIRCTSVPGHRLPVGSDFANTLRDELGETSLVVGLLTRNAMSSGWVLFELGATWGARNNLKPLISDEIDFKELPGPLSGQHAARLSSKSDLSQVIEEITNMISASARSHAKIDNAIDKLIATHAEYIKAQSQPPGGRRVEAKVKEPTIGGMPVRELIALLYKEKITVPAKVTAQRKEFDTSLLELFVSNAQSLADGVLSTLGRDTYGGFVYHEVGLRLLPFGLVEFEKLLPQQAVWFKRLVMSSEGHKLIVYWKRLNSERKSGKGGI
jgi:hypothetical protein